VTRRGRSSIFFEIYALGQAVRQYIDEAMADAPLTPEEYAYYSVLFEDERATPTLMAARLSVPKTTVMEYVRLMERRRHARRLPHPSDGRSYELVLTAAGLAAHHQSNVLFEAGYARFVAGLRSDEKRAMRRLAELRGAVIAADRRDEGGDATTPANTHSRDRRRVR